MKRKITSLILTLTMAVTIVGSIPAATYAAYNPGIAGFTYEDYWIPSYDGDAYEIVNNNDPEFLPSEMVTKSKVNIHKSNNV